MKQNFPFYLEETDLALLYELGHGNRSLGLRRLIHQELKRRADEKARKNRVRYIGHKDDKKFKGYRPWENRKEED